MMRHHNQYAQLYLVKLILVRFSSVQQKSGENAAGTELSCSFYSAADFVSRGKQEIC